MDLDSCGTDSFYDEIASLIPQAGDYSLDDIEEILRSTVTHLDASIDLKTFVPHNIPEFEIPAQQQEFGAPPHDDALQLNFNTFPSPATTTTSASTTSTPPYVTQRSFSTSSDDADHFNPDEFINFLNDDDIKIEDFTSDTVMEMPQRNTPSPTDSCSSSSGSSTSGVHSDASFDTSMSHASYNDCATMVVNEENPSVDVDMSEQFSASVAITMPLTPTPTAAAFGTTVLPLTVPLLPMLPPAAPINLVPRQMPVKKLPLTSITPVAHIKTPAPIKVSPELAPKSIITSAQPAATPLKIVAAASASGKLTPPTNSKPKTIFLSSNDFKTLMQKMNTNGKGAKITGGINADQMPKIIVKTPTGKVITSNKIGQSSTTTTTIAMAAPATPTVTVGAVATGAQHQHQLQPPHYAPKFVKATGPLVIKQHQQHTTRFHTSGRACNPNIYKGVVDEKMYKKQQRMIKNRESASLSRKKKKEYVVSLESRINNLERENYKLKGENSTLRSQLVAFAQTCHCKHSNVSEFILNSLNINARVANGSSGGGGGGGFSIGGASCSSEHHHVKIAPKPAPKSIKQRLTTANMKKNVAVLFAMAFMVTLNVGNFQTYLNKNSIESDVDTVEEPLTAAGGRHLLWVESETEFAEKLNRSRRETELEVPPPPPLHFLRPINRTIGANGTKHEPPSTQTENQRLASNLHKWIDGNDYLNLSIREKFDNDLENPGGFKLSSDYYGLKTIDLPLQGPVGVAKQKRKIYIHDGADYDHKQSKLDTDNGDRSDNDNDNGGGGKNSLDLFKPQISDEYMRLFKGIKRQDDTFYVLSFNMDHVLLPASAYNKSSRPKMSLILPAGDPTLDGDVVLMQIDCEVVNTTELQLKSDMIPAKLRPNKFGPANLHPTSTRSNDMAKNETRNGRGAHAHRFRGSMHATKRALVEQEEVAPDHKEMEKPPIRTYFMMGPKTQTKKKPTIIKLSGNDTIADAMRSSTLYAKMRDTVEGEFVSLK